MDPCNPRNGSSQSASRKAYTMNAAETEPSVQPPRFRDAFERLLNDIRAVHESEFVPIIVDIPSAVTTILGAWVEIRPLRAQIVKDVPSFDIRLLDGLESYALALGHAQTAYQTATDPPASLVALADSAIKEREILLADVNALIARGLIAPSALKELKGINGHKNIAFDLFALANILEKNWTKVAERTGVKREELDQAQMVADKLVTAVGEREQAPAIAAEAVRDRQAAFTLCVNAYDEVRSVIAYLRRKQGDVESIAPSLYAGRTSSKKKPAESNNDQPPATVPTGTAVVAGTLPAAAGANTNTSQAHPSVTSAAGPYV
jgi:hypothetical protein